MFNRFRVWVARFVLPVGYRIIVEEGDLAVRQERIAELKKLWTARLEDQKARYEAIRSNLGQQGPWKMYKSPFVLGVIVDEEEIARAEAEADQVEAEMRSAIAAVRAQIQANRDERNANSQD